MPMKPKTRVMAVSTMLTLTVSLAALFFYIEEKKYEALYYQTELTKLQQQSGFDQLMQQIATQSSNTAINTLHQSRKIQALSEQQAQQLIKDISAGRKTEIALSEADVSAINRLLGQ